MTDYDKTINEAKADMLPFESWERINGETSKAYDAFCVYRDLGAERTIRMAVEAKEKDKTKQEGRYRTWRNYSMQFRWRERAADYDKYLEKLKQTELRKTIELQGEKHREVTGKMLDVVYKKLDTMNPEELTQNNVTEWVQTAIKTERDAAGLVTTSWKPEVKQGEFNFSPDFQGI